MSPRKQYVLVASGLVVLTLLAFAHVCRNDFINFDDPHYVTANENVSAGLSFATMAWAWTTFHAGYWMPLTWLSLQLDATLYWPAFTRPLSLAASEAAWGFHLTNLLWHLANTLLVCWLVRRWTASLGQAVAVAALFAVHPLRVESVAWITERKDVLSTFFGLVTLLLYDRHTEKPSWTRNLPILPCMLAALLAKPMLVTLPALLLLLDWWLQRRPASWLWLVAEKLPLFALSAVMTAVTIFAQKEVGAVGSLQEYPFTARLANAVVSYESYLAKAFWPTDLACFYPHPHDALTTVQVMHAVLVLLAISGLVLAASKKVPALLVGWLWFTIALLPVSGLIQAGAQGMADRFTYFPLLGLFVAVVAAARYLAERWRVAPLWQAAFATLVLAILTAATHRQVSLWRDCDTLYRHALVVTADNACVEGLLGVFYFHKGTDAENAKQPTQAEKSWTDAEHHLARSVAISPSNSAEVHLYYGLALERKQSWQEAVAQLEKSVELRSDWPSGHFYLGKALWHLSRDNPTLRPRAEQQLRIAVHGDPGYAASVAELLKPR